MHSCLLRRYLCVFTLLMAVTTVFAGCGKSSGSSSGLLALLGGGEPGVLEAPQNVTASNGSFTDRVTVAWDAVTGATYYQVYRCDTEDGTYELISDNETLTTYDDTDPLVTDVNYYYKVKAFNGTTESEFSDFAVGKTGFEPLDTPQNVTATDGTQTGKITVTWDAVTGATYYQVSRSTNPDTGYSVISGDETLASYEDTTVTPAIDYYYKVQAFNDTQSSVSSDYSLGMAGLAAPGNVAATDGTYTDRVEISWDAADGASHYRVYRSTDDDTGFADISGLVTGTSYSDDTGTPGTDYYYRVKAVTGDVESALSSYSMGMTALAAPQDVAATDSTYTDRVEIEWSAVDGAAHYVVYRSTDQDTGFTALSGNLADTSYDDTTATPGTDYYYRVKAFSGSNESAFSMYALGSIGLVPPPAAPANPAATQNTFTDRVTVSWDSVADADYYRLFRSDTVDGSYTTQIGADITGTSQDDTTVVPGTHYFYKVKAINENGTSEFSASAEGWAEEEEILPLDAPANVSASDRTSATTVTITWDAVTDADYYRVYRAFKSDGDYVQVGGNITGTSYGDSDTFEDLAYYYKVKAFDDVRGESAFSAADTGRCELTRPEYLSRFNINWEYMMTKLINNTSFPPSSLGTSNYNVNGDTSGSIGVSVYARISGFNIRATTTFTWAAYYDFGMIINSGTEVTDCNASGDGTHTGTVYTTGNYAGTIVENYTTNDKVRNGGSADVTYGGGTENVTFADQWGPGIKLSTPANASATQGTDGTKVVISWSPVYGANYYQVYRATSSGGTYAQVGGNVAGSTYAADGTVYTFDDTTGVAGTHYFYKVRATNTFVINDQDGDQTHDSNETPYSAYSSIVEGWR